MGNSAPGTVSLPPLPHHSPFLFPPPPFSTVHPCHDGVKAAAAAAMAAAEAVSATRAAIDTKRGEGGNLVWGGGAGGSALCSGDLRVPGLPWLRSVLGEKHSWKEADIRLKGVAQTGTCTLWRDSLERDMSSCCATGTRAYWGPWGQLKHMPLSATECPLAASPPVPHWPPRPPVPHAPPTSQCHTQSRALRVLFDAAPFWAPPAAAPSVVFHTRSRRWASTSVGAPDTAPAAAPSVAHVKLRLAAPVQLLRCWRLTRRRALGASSDQRLVPPPAAPGPPPSIAPPVPHSAMLLRGLIRRRIHIKPPL